MSDQIVSALYDHVDILGNFAHHDTRCCTPPRTADFAIGNPLHLQVRDTPNDVESCSPSSCLDAFLDEQCETQDNDALSQFYRNEVNTCAMVGWKIHPTLDAECSVLMIAAMAFRKGQL